MIKLNAITISIGDELLSGKTIDSNNAYISQQFELLGIPVIKKLIVGDDRQDIIDALDWGFSQADILTLTGGLGPTHDDITKSVLCDYFGVGLVRYPKLLEKLKERFMKRGFKFSISNESQAEYPENASLLENPVGTAQGMHFVHHGKHLFVMAGVPNEMKAVTDIGMVPILTKLTSASVSIIDIHSIGIPESTLFEFSKPIFDEYPQVKVAYLPKQGMVTIRLSMNSSELAENEALLLRIYEQLRQLKPKNIYGRDQEDLSRVIGNLLLKQKATVATAESCTGGLVASMITDTAGSSEYFNTGFVTYANATKRALLDVKSETLDQYGAVSEETVSEMLVGTLKRSGSHYAVAISGIAGPGGGSDDKPVGTVYIGVADSARQIVQRFQFGNNRVMNKRMSAFTALNQLRLFLEGLV